MAFLNQAAFDQAASYQLALGKDLSAQGIFLDSIGNVLFRIQTVGLISPVLREIRAGEALFRFTNSTSDVRTAMEGGWWIAIQELEHVQRFARANDLTDPMAARILLGIPPEWHDLGLLVKVRTVAPLLAFSGVANSVIVPHPVGGPDVTMVHQNAHAARRLRQLFIPGMRTDDWNASQAGEAFTLEGEWRFARADTMRGWIYV